MNALAGETRTVIIEREIAHPPERVWRALTQPNLMAEWLMRTDFAPVVGQQFNFRADWGSVACRVLAVAPQRVLSYSWDALGLESVVTWTLDPSGAETRLRMEQAGFAADQEQAFQGAKYGWQQFLDKLDHVLAQAD